MLLALLVCNIGKTLENRDKFLILASGNGTNALKLWEHSLRKKYNCIGVLSNLAEARINKECYSRKIPIFLIESKNKTKEKYNDLLFEFILKNEIDWLFLAGYMRIIPPSIIKHFHSPKLGNSKIINIHPSFLPDFKGKDASIRNFRSNKTYSGVSVHHVDEGIDTGKIIFQEKFNKIENESFESFQKREKAIEHKLFPKTLDHFFEPTKGLSHEL